ncbi:MAG: amidohydrolase family protein [Chitinophagaceae bacterium]
MTSFPTASRKIIQEDTLAWKRRFELQLKLTGILNGMGVPILSGADATPESHTALLGFCLHDELSLLVQAGLPPLQTLQAATLNPARYFGIADKLGTKKLVIGQIL